MDPKRLAKLQAIQDWKINKPTKDSDWAEDVKKESLHIKFDYQLTEMETSHSAKILKVQKDLDIFLNWPDVKRYELTQQFIQMFKGAKIEDGGQLKGKILQEWIDEEFDSQKLMYEWKVAKLEQSVERIKKERELRSSGFVVTNKNDDKSFKDIKNVPEEKRRYLLGTEYFIDPVNGTNTFAGTRIDSTVDSTADTTHLVDNALTGADDYLNGSYLYNVTRGLGSLITDFVAATDTVTLADAITGMTAGDTYYILNAWLDLDQFTENARSAGDKVIIRRGANQCDDGTDLNFTSSGEIGTPIIVESDFDNLWRDQTDLSGTATATLIIGSKTVTFSSDVSGVLAAGDWIYASGDNNRLFAYEVKTVSTVTVTLFLPYKGGQAGSGKTMFNMQDNPIWNTTAGNFQINFDVDNNWKFQGMNLAGADGNGVVEIDSCLGHTFLDCVFTGVTTNKAIAMSDDRYFIFVKKCRDIGGDSFFESGIDSYGKIIMQDCLTNPNDECITEANPSLVIADIEEVEAISGTYFYEGAQGTGLEQIKLRNPNFNGNTNNFVIDSNSFSDMGIFVEDYDNVPGDTRYMSPLVGDVSDTFPVASDTGTLRSGGSNKSIKVTGLTTLSNLSQIYSLKVFELPIYATTDSKTYTVYMRPTAITDWTADPLATELWLEASYWGHATNNFRKITKSTGTIDMNGSTLWQTLTVTVAPGQAGVLYLRLWYAKTKEAAKANTFYVDPIPVIS